MFIPLGSLPSNDQSAKKPRGVQFLILANITVFIYQLYLYYGDISLAMRHGAVPREVVTVSHVIPFFPIILPNLLHPSLITSLFLHDVRILEGGFIHIIGNMLYLSAFGPNLEDRIGHLKFLCLYLFSGVVATLLYVLVNYSSDIPLIGASGAVAGVMGAHFIACRKSRIRCLFLIFIRPLPASVVLLPWMIIQVLNVSFSYHGTPVAWLAHIGGFGMGIFFIRKFQRCSLPTQVEDTELRQITYEPIGRPKRRSNPL